MLLRAWIGDNYWFFNNLEELQKETKASIAREKGRRIETAIYRQGNSPEFKMKQMEAQLWDMEYIKPDGVETPSEKHQRESDMFTRKAVHNVYRRGWMPLNRTE